MLNRLAFSRIIIIEDLIYRLYFIVSVTDEIPAEPTPSHMIQISFIEYQELKHKELKYDLILNALQQCI